MPSFATYILRRLIAAVLTLIGVSLVVFLLLRALPGDPARIIAGIFASPEEVEQVRVREGLDLPFPQQYARFVGRLLQGDLGESSRTKRPVLEEISARLPATLYLALVAVALTALVGVTAGVLAAVRPYSTIDYLVSFGSLIGISLPSYWLGLMLIVVFAVQLRWFPAAGSDQPTSIILPAIALTIVLLAFVVRITRVAMLETLSQEYVRTARAKGLSASLVVYRHALKNAIIPVLTILGLQFGGLISGAVFVETIFGLPGIGLLLTESISARDYAVVQGTTLMIATMYVLLNLAIDVLYVVVDPRIRYD
jgi:ABC-type dipeptide/oligopeptide/nickel transport system permease component